MDKLVLINKNSKCSFCGTCKNDCLKYGPIYQLRNIRAHYYCVLLSNRLIQNGNDNEGILGFLLSDIQKELERTLKISCAYCKKGNATIKCAAKKCRRSFHLPCGMKGGSLHEFTDQFKSYCHVHRPTQNIPPSILKEACKTDVICCICYEKVHIKHKIDSLWAPCCSRTWYHRFCVQKLAHSAGYFFRCAACNDVQVFNKWMQKFGIFIPQQDASWELVPNAFDDLLYRHDKCDAEVCKCPDGRQKNAENTIWEIVLCESCGSQGIHVACGNLKFLDPEWECPSCLKITRNRKSALETSTSVNLDEDSSVEGRLSKLSEVYHKKRRRDSEDLENSILDKRKKCRTFGGEENGDEFEIDVETVEEESKSKDVSEHVNQEKNIFNEEVTKVKNKKEAELQEVLCILKPGPLSYKLSVLRKICESSSKKTNQNSDVIELSDSDEEKAYKDGVKLVEENAKQSFGEDLDLFFPDELNKGSDVEKEVKVKTFDSVNAEEISAGQNFFFTPNTKNRDTDHLLTSNENPAQTNFVNDSRQHISPSNSLWPEIRKNTHDWFFENEVKNCKLNKLFSDIEEEKDFKIISNDEVMIIID